MRLLSTIIFSVLVLESCQEQALDQHQPQQIHLAYGETVRDIVVTWSTKQEAESVVKYTTMNPANPSHHYVKYGQTQKFVDGGPLRNSQYIHRVVLDDLKPNRRYEYHVGSSLGWSAVYWFKTPPVDLEHWQPHLAIYGDMGNVNAQSLPRLQEETQAGMYDAILHVGDFAYNFETNNGAVGDEFMTQLEPIAAYLPYMVCPGNHEEAYNFSHYRNRFSMPGPYESLFYSIDIGPIHLLSLTTEVYYKNYADLLRQEKLQYEFMENDLKKATQDSNRVAHPWILTIGHRPMYCGNDDTDDCTKVNSLVRNGLDQTRHLENLFYRHQVDVEIWGHEHTYERLWPIFNYTVYNGSVSEPYNNPPSPVHIITGSAGCQERTDTFRVPPPEWSAFRSSDYGYTRLKVFNKTHLRFQQVSDDQLGMVIDEWWLVRDFPRLRYPLRV